LLKIKTKILVFILFYIYFAITNIIVAFGYQCHVGNQRSFQDS